MPTTTLSAAAKAHYRLELDADSRSRDHGLDPEATRFSRCVYASRLRRAVASEIEVDELEALIGYAADHLDANRIIPNVPLMELLKALAEVQLDSLIVVEAGDDRGVKEPEPTSPLLTTPESGSDEFVVLLIMLQPTQELEPPANPARFRAPVFTFA